MPGLRNLTNAKNGPFAGPVLARDLCLRGHSPRLVGYQAASPLTLVEATLLP